MVYLDPFAAEDVERAVLEIVEAEGLSPGEAIPGLVDAILSLADGNDELLDATANYLADGGTRGSD